MLVCVIGRLTTIIMSVSGLQLAPEPFRIIMGTIAIQDKSLHATLIAMLSLMQVPWRPFRRAAALCSGCQESMATGPFNGRYLSTGELVCSEHVLLDCEKFYPSESQVCAH